MNEWSEWKPRRFTSLAAATEYADREIQKPRGAGKTIVEVVQQKRREDGHRAAGAVKDRWERDADGKITRTPLV
jgi:hypothetical protein